MNKGLFMIFASNGKNRTYYVSNSGIVGNSGLTESSPLPPDEVVNYLSTAGKILFKSGETFRGLQLNIEANTEINSYGPEAKPILIGSDKIQNETWTSLGSGKYSLLVSDFKWLFVTGQSSKQAIDTNSYEILERIDDYNLRFDPSMLTQNMTGASFFCKQRTWIYSTMYTVVAHNVSTGVITTAEKLYIRIIASSLVGDVSFANLESFITTDFQWVYDGGKIIMQLPSPPQNYTIRNIKKEYTFGINRNGKIENCDIQDYYYTGIVGAVDCSGAVIQDNQISNTRHDGISLLNESGNLSIKNNVIHDVFTGGIYGQAINNFIINENNIYNVGMGDDPAVPVNEWTVGSSNRRSQEWGAAGIILRHYDDYSAGNELIHDFVVKENEVKNTAYSGIIMVGAKDGEVYYNHVHDVMNVLIDGGGIYGRNWNTYIFDGLINVHHNIVYDVHHRSNSNAGIYLDQITQKWHVYKNTIGLLDGTALGAKGLNVNFDTYQHLIEHNTIVAGAYNAIKHNYDGDNLNHSHNGNILITKSASIPLVENVGNPFLPSGTTDNNYFIAPNSSAAIDADGNDLASYRTLYGGDTNSTADVNRVSSPDIQIIINPSTSVLTGTAPAGYSDVDGNAVTNYSIQPFESLVLIENV